MKDFLGNSYDYGSRVASTRQMGVSSRGNMGALKRDIAAVMRYTDFLIDGASAKKKSDPLGNRYFAKTPAKCVPVGLEKAGKDGTPILTDRHIYIDNVPSVPGLKGFIPGMIENSTKINAFGILSAFDPTSKTYPSCVKCPYKVCKVTEGDRNKFITVSDFESIRGKKMSKSEINKMATQSEKSIKEKFDNLMHKVNNNKISVIHNSMVSVLFLYILFKYMNKH